METNRLPVYSRTLETSSVKRALDRELERTPEGMAAVWAVGFDGRVGVEVDLPVRKRIEGRFDKMDGTRKMKMFDGKPCWEDIGPKTKKGRVWATGKAAGERGLSMQEVTVHLRRRDGTPWAESAVLTFLRGDLAECGIRVKQTKDGRFVFGEVPGRYADTRDSWREARGLRPMRRVRM